MDTHAQLAVVVRILHDLDVAGALRVTDPSQHPEDGGWSEGGCWLSEHDIVLAALHRLRLRVPGFSSGERSESRAWLREHGVPLPSQPH